MHNLIRKVGRYIILRSDDYVIAQMHRASICIPPGI